jgi:hypothetical protein
MPRRAGAIAPESAEHLKDCLQLKENTRNRLKLLHPPEARTDKNSQSIYQILELQPPPRKSKFKPFSDRITNPLKKYSRASNERPKSAPAPEKPRLPLGAALNFVKRQTEWLSNKNQSVEPENLANFDLEKVRRRVGRWPLDLF